MRGLIRNNFYNIDQTLKLLIGMMVFSLLFVLGVNILGEQMQVAQFTDIALLATVGAFSSVSVEMLKNEASSKWSRFELTTPITKADVIKGRYITYALFTLIAIMFLTLGFVIPMFFGHSFDTNWYTYYLTMLLCFNLLAPAISHPLVLKFGVDKGMGFYMMSVMLSLVLFLSPPLIFADFFESISIQDLLYRFTISAICLVSFWISYLISKKMYVSMDI